MGFSVFWPISILPLHSLLRLLSLIDFMTDFPGIPILVAGDFNIAPNLELDRSHLGNVRGEVGSGKKGASF